MKLSELQERLDLSKSDYKINKAIFRAALTTIAVLLLSVVLLDGVDVLYKSSVGMCCPEETTQGCHNPFFLACDEPLCEDPIIERGVCVGDAQPSFLAQNFGTATIFILIASLLLNHFLYNRGYFKGEKKCI